MMRRLSGSFLVISRSSDRESARVFSDTEPSFDTSAFAVRRFTSMFATRTPEL